MRKTPRIFKIFEKNVLEKLGFRNLQEKLENIALSDNVNLILHGKMNQNLRYTMGPKALYTQSLVIELENKCDFINDLALLRQRTFA